AAGEYEKAAEAFATAARQLERRPGPGGVPTDMDRGRFRSRQVECMYRAKKGLKAYTDMRDTNTFRQLAGLYAADKDAAGLRELIAAHRKGFPESTSAGYWQAEAHFI